MSTIACLRPHAVGPPRRERPLTPSLLALVSRLLVVVAEQNLERGGLFVSFPPTRCDPQRVGPIHPRAESAATSDHLTVNGSQRRRSERADSLVACCHPQNQCVLVMATHYLQTDRQARTREAARDT